MNFKGLTDANAGYLIRIGTITYWHL